MKQYGTQFGLAKWANILYLKAGFHNILFQHTSLWDSILITHWGKFWWLRIPIGLIQALSYFQFVVESVLYGEPGSCPLPVAIYLDDIAMYGDT